MVQIFEKKDWPNLDAGERNCYLLTNGRGGFQSLSIIGSNARQDHAFFMAAKTAPNVRFHYVTNLYEELVIDGRTYILTTQKMYEGEDLRGFQYLTSFTYETYPVWTYQIEDVVFEKKMLYANGRELTAVSYEILQGQEHEISLKVKPLFRFTAKNTAMTKAMSEEIKTDVSENSLQVGEDTLYFQSTGKLQTEEKQSFGPMYFTQDERDGREEQGYCFTQCQFLFDEMKNKENSILFSTEVISDKDSFSELLQERMRYEKALLCQAKVTSNLGKQLALSADAYVVDRESTNGKSVIAGYPFFEDWGRDTMIAMHGLTLTTGRYTDCKSMLKTFAKYEKEGLLPNLFPEGGKDPMYNSVDAPLLFINAVYEYIQETKDEDFLEEVWEKLESILTHYQTGTTYHIGMDADGLIRAGADMEQLTWMDVRVGDYLPTPRHGKPVEINAYWYNDLCIMAELGRKRSEKVTEMSEKEALLQQAAEYEKLALTVKESFLAQFWNAEEQCLKDVINGTAEENQIRCNQIWALTLPYTMLSLSQEKKVIDKVREELYTTAGLRTLSRKDVAFRGIYIGDMVNRDRAYHQGTVWAYPLGAYYRACISYLSKTKGQDKDLLCHVREGMEALEKWLKEGCLNHLAEIYDGEQPTVSRGCFAQAWSDAELLRAVQAWECYQENQ